MAFVKLDCGILDSSLWSESSDTCKVFLTMLAMCDPDGLCRATAPGIAGRARLAMDVVRAALGKLEAPDPDSRSEAEEGRRIVRCDGGYHVVNYLRYREYESPAARRVREYRERKRALQPVTGVTGVTRVTQKEKEKEKEKKEGEVESDRAKAHKFHPPSIEELRAYLTERQSPIDPERFLAYYESNGWKVGRNPMRDWKAAVRTWERGEASPKAKKRLVPKGMWHPARMPQDVLDDWVARPERYKVVKDGFEEKIATVEMVEAQA